MTENAPVAETMNRICAACGRSFLKLAFLEGLCPHCGRPADQRTDATDPVLQTAETAVNNVPVVPTQAVGHHLPSFVQRYGLMLGILGMLVMGGIGWLCWPAEVVPSSLETSSPRTEATDPIDDLPDRQRLQRELNIAKKKLASHDQSVAAIREELRRAREDMAVCEAERHASDAERMQLRQKVETLERTIQDVRLGKPLDPNVVREVRIDPAKRIFEVVKLDLPAGTFAVPVVDKGSHLKISGRVKVLEMKSITGSSVVDLTELQVAEITISSTIASGASLRVSSPGARVRLLDISTKAEVDLHIPGGKVTLRNINSDAKLKVYARDIEVTGSIGGPMTQVKATLSADGSLKFKGLSAGELTWRTEQPTDPLPKISAGTVGRTALFKRVD